MHCFWSYSGNPTIQYDASCKPYKPGTGWPSHWLYMSLLALTMITQIRWIQFLSSHNRGKTSAVPAVKQQGCFISATNDRTMVETDRGSDILQVWPCKWQEVMIGSLRSCVLFSILPSYAVPYAVIPSRRVRDNSFKTRDRVCSSIPVVSMCWTANSILESSPKNTGLG